MSLVRVEPNDYGTPTAWGNCDTCGRPYGVCPAPALEKWGNWKNCLADDCPSYDVSRDVDMFFEPMADHGLITRTTTKRGDHDS
jgi:hypothetical protein